MKIPAILQHEHALTLRARRNEVLASNIANADTPNYKARDFDFAAAMRSQRRDAARLPADGLQIGGAGNIRDLALQYRVPHQPTLDGNTVEADVEQAAFAENALHYRVSLAFLDAEIRTLKFALKGSD